jgi:hypothetical protein
MGQCHAASYFTAGAGYRGYGEFPGPFLRPVSLGHPAFDLPYYIVFTKSSPTWPTTTATLNTELIRRTGRALSCVVQLGLISKTEMMNAIIIFIMLSLASGLWLLYISLGFSGKTFYFFLCWV